MFLNNLLIFNQLTFLWDTSELKSSVNPIRPQLLNVSERECILGFMLIALGLEAEYAMIGKSYSSEELLKAITATYPSFISLVAANGYDIVAEEGQLSLRGVDCRYYLM